MLLGSAPRARGTPRIPIGSADDGRFSPAGAGNTNWRMPHVLAQAVQPRGRGEHAIHVNKHVTCGGSAPRARGTPAATQQRYQMERFSPAGAGNTRGARCTAPRRAVQPRGRGEHVLARRRSPGRVRFSPAGAGNTKTIKLYRGVVTVQPRGRGEHPLMFKPHLTRYGSAPRARGTLSLIRDVLICPLVQPRGRGEHLPTEGGEVALCGSAPRARGTPRHVLL